MIEVLALNKRYGDFTAVRELSFAVQPGEVLGLVGPNGAGKTTTLRCLAGIIPANGGTVTIGGVNLAQDPVAAKRLLAFFPDEPRLFDYLTVRQHLAFVARIYGVTDHEALAGPLLEELEIADKADQLPGELSRGMKQKLAIACGLLHSPAGHILRRAAHRPRSPRHPPHEGLHPPARRRGRRHRAELASAAPARGGVLARADPEAGHEDRPRHARRRVAQFANGESGVSLEEVFIRATGGSES